MFYLATVEVTDFLDNDKIKKHTENYLIENAVSITDAEAQVVGHFETEGGINEYEIKSIKVFKLNAIIPQD